jgi:hypothetical protein
MKDDRAKQELVRVAKDWDRAMVENDAEAICWRTAKSSAGHASMKDVRAHQVGLKRIVRQWIKYV